MKYLFNDAVATMRGCIGKRLVICVSAVQIRMACTASRAHIYAYCHSETHCAYADREASKITLYICEIEER